MPDVPASSSRPVPPRVGRYEVLLPIASGGMATVYLARSQGARGFERDVALKLTHAHLTDTSDFAAILLEEARIASRIRHRNVVSILDVGEDPLGLFLVMDYVEGDTLAGLLRGAAVRSEPMPPRIGLRILLDALAGLHAAHELSDPLGKSMEVVHRDFSPQNILVGIDGIAQLADFGIAKAADRSAETATGIVKGKVSYMSPEHARALAIDRRADVWSAGVVAWEIFAGRRLHTSHEGLATLLKVISERPPRLGAAVPDIAPAVEEVVARALEPDLVLRYPTAEVLARDLADAFGSSGGLALHEEVAEYVRRVTGPKLETRRVQVEHALRLRRKMAALAEASMSDNTEVTPHADSSIRTPAPLRSSSVVELESSDFDTVAEGGPPVATTPSLLTAPSSLTDTTSASDALRRSLLPWLGQAQRRWLGASVGLVLAGSMVFLAVGKNGGYARNDSRAVVADSVPVPRDAVPPSTPPPSTSPAAPEHARVPVRVHANARVSSLRVDTRAVALTPPAADVMLERLAEDGDGSLTVVAIAVDGRRRTMMLTPDATSLDIEFPALPARPIATASRPAPSPAPKKAGSEIPPNPFATSTP
jgi:serine/threonine protein kinase